MSKGYGRKYITTAHQRRTSRVTAAPCMTDFRWHPCKLVLLWGLGLFLACVLTSAELCYACTQGLTPPPASEHPFLLFPLQVSSGLLFLSLCTAMHQRPEGKVRTNQTSPGSLGKTYSERGQALVTCHAGPAGPHGDSSVSKANGVMVRPTMQ